MSIWESRKFRALVVDTVSSTAVFFVTHYLAPQAQEAVLSVIAAWQPVVIAVILGWAYEDGKEKGAPVVQASRPTDEAEMKAERDFWENLSYTDSAGVLRNLSVDPGAGAVGGMPVEDKPEA